MSRTNSKRKYAAVPGDQGMGGDRPVLETTDLLAVLLRDPDTIAAEILSELGLDGETVSKAMNRPVTGSWSPGDNSSGPRDSEGA
jgi:hypothetical protein